MTIQTWDLSGTSPASAVTVAGLQATGLSAYSGLRVDVQIQGATGGTLDIYLQRKIAPNVWVDWCAFTQLAAAGALTSYSFCVQNGNSSATIASDVVTTRGNDASPNPGMAAGLIAEHPGDTVRVVYKAGASTSAGAAQKIYITSIGPSR